MLLKRKCCSPMWAAPMRQPGKQTLSKPNKMLRSMTRQDSNVNYPRMYNERKLNLLNLKRNSSSGQKLSILNSNKINFPCTCLSSSRHHVLYHHSTLYMKERTKDDWCVVLKGYRSPFFSRLDFFWLLLSGKKETCPNSSEEALPYVDCPS